MFSVGCLPFLSGTREGHKVLQISGVLGYQWSKKTNRMKKHGQINGYYYYHQHL